MKQEIRNKGALTPARQAWKNARANDYSDWPVRPGEDNRLNTPVNPVFQPSFFIDPGSKIFTAGSCFARNIERHLDSLGCRIPSLDFTVPADEWGADDRNGIINKYHGFAILNELSFALDPLCPLSPEDYLLEIGNDQYLDLQLPSLAAVSQARAIERRLQIRDIFAQAVQCQYAVITLGLIEAWWDAEKSIYVTPAIRPKVARDFPDRFYFKVLGYEEIRESIEQIVTLLTSEGSQIKGILLSVSPVPLKKTFTSQDVIVANMHSKSLLRAVAQSIVEQFEIVDYFPSFESIMLSDRTSVYMEDLRHVTDEAVYANVMRMVSAYYKEHTGKVDIKQRLAMARSAIRADDTDKAFSIIQLLEEECKGNLAEYHAVKSQIFRAVGEAASEREELVAAVSIDKSNAVYWFELATVYFQIGQIDLSLEAISKSEELGLSKLAMKSLRAKIMMSLGRFDEAKESILSALKMRANPESIRLLGHICRHEGKAEEAVEHYRHAIKLADHDVEARIALIELLHEKGDSEGAQLHLQALQQNTGNRQVSPERLEKLHEQLGV